jgi:hypothetical protein
MAVPARRPFWLPASNYYVLAAAFSLAFFFLVWGILRDEGEETPWITAGVGASIILGGAVILRELVLRRTLHRLQAASAEQHSRVILNSRRHHGRGKLTLEQNAALINEIRQKSNAAKILNKFSAGHREVFELCSEYIARNETELKTVDSASPRLSPLLKGRKTAGEFHRHHMLQWAEIEATSLTGEAASRPTVEDRMKAANEALGVIEYALEHYPAEQSLLQSGEVLREMAVSIRVSDLVEKAERAAFKGDNRGALGLYRDALFYLGRDNVHTDERDQAARHITAEIEKISLPENSG